MTVEISAKNLVTSSRYECVIGTVIADQISTKDTPDCNPRVGPLCLEGSESPIYSKSPVCSAVEAAAIVILLSSRPSAHDPALSPWLFYFARSVLSLRRPSVPFLTLPLISRHAIHQFDPSTSPTRPPAFGHWCQA